MAIKLTLFFIFTIALIIIFRNKQRKPEQHGFWRFFAFESILILVIQNGEYWFRDPFAKNREQRKQQDREDGPEHALSEAQQNASVPLTRQPEGPQAGGDDARRHAAGDAESSARIGGDEEDGRQATDAAETEEEAPPAPNKKSG